MNNLKYLVLPLNINLGLGEKSPSLFIMTILYGFGMLGVGILALIIGGGIAFYVINKVIEEDDRE